MVQLAFPQDDNNKINSMKKLKEIFTVSHEYKNLSKKRKIEILALLLDWTNNELTNLTGSNKCIRN